MSRVHLYQAVTKDRSRWLSVVYDDDEQGFVLQIAEDSGEHFVQILLSPESTAVLGCELLNQNLDGLAAIEDRIHQAFAQDLVAVLRPVLERPARERSEALALPVRKVLPTRMAGERVAA